LFIGFYGKVKIGGCVTSFIIFGGLSISDSPAIEDYERG